MTTFTIQDLTPAQLITDHLNAPEVPRETKDALVGVLHNHSINNLPTTPEEDEAMQALSEKQFVEYGMNNPISASAIEYATQHAVPPQPSAEVLHNSKVSPEAVIDEMLFTIKQSLLLLATVISQSKAQPDTTPPEGDQPSLQETVELVFKQSDWFKDMIKDEVESRVESEVEMYFERRFSPEDHFDFNDAVSNEVADRLDDVVRDRIDEAVEEQLEEVVSNKLQNLRVVFD
jgi:hypothetical protein